MHLLVDIVVVVEIAMEKLFSLISAGGTVATDGTVAMDGLLALFLMARELMVTFFCLAFLMDLVVLEEGRESEGLGL